MRKRILVVEDMPNWQEVIFELLHQDYDLTIVSTINEARAAIEHLDDSKKFALAILDVRLEHDNTFNVQGMVFLEEIRKTYPNLPIIVFSMFPEHIPAHILVHLGVELVTKHPFEYKTFITYISKAVNSE